MRIVVGSDVSARAERALARAYAIATAAGGSVSVVHAVTADVPSRLREAAADAAQEELETVIGALGAPPSDGISVDIRSGPCAQSISEVAEAMGADLIVLGVHRDAKGPMPLVGSTIERVLRCGRTPVLVVRDAARAPYSTILAAADFSVPARRAFDLARRIAPGAAATLVHAYQTPFLGFLGETARADARARHAADLAGELGDFAGGLPGTGPVESLLLEGEPASVIARAIDTVRPDLLVLGSHGRLGAAGAVLGGVAQHFLRAPPCDVLAAPGW